MEDCRGCNEIPNRKRGYQMNVRNLNYANMVKEAQEELNKIWVPNIGDLAIDEAGMVGVITNRDKQEIKLDPDTIIHSYIGVSVVHNGKLWRSCNPIWMPQLWQILELIYGTKKPKVCVEEFAFWLFSADINYVESDELTEVKEVALIHYMKCIHNKVWNFEEKKWEVLT